jgi:hypothetical protein
MRIIIDLSFVKRFFTKKPDPVPLPVPECGHRFNYHQVIDLNITASELRCDNCKRSFTSLEAEKPEYHASFKHVQLVEGAPPETGYYTIRFTKRK